jgi:hypothetical protein
LPWSGGFLSWPAYHYSRLRLARVIRAIFRAYGDAENPAEWTNNNPEQFKIVAYVTRERRRIAKEAVSKKPFKQSVIGYIERQRRVAAWQ